MRVRSGMKIIACCGLVLLACSAGPLRAATLQPVVSEPPVQGEAGAWQENRYSFVFMGFTTTYSCDGLADKLKILLIASGARSDAKAQPGACASGLGRPDRFARAELVFYTLTPADTAAPTADMVRTTAPGTWRSVVVSSRSPRELRSGDCELVEQFISNVLPMFTTRNVASNTTCIPHQESGSNIDLKFETFAAASHSGGQTMPKKMAKD